MSGSEKIHPLLCKPLLKEKMWGGRKLEEMFGMQLPQGQKIGEAWLVADLKEGTSSIMNGEMAGKTLSEVTEQLGVKLIGSSWLNASTGNRFPLLIKYLDAQDNLSIQVHPDKDTCRKFFPNAFSKDESWIILQADVKSTILLGFKQGVNINMFDKLIAEDKITESLQSILVSPGQVYRVAPGTIHGLNKGVAILEIQEPSDTTFRVYDYDRLDDRRKPRKLHIEEARKVIRFDEQEITGIHPTETDMPWGKHELAVDVLPYRIERITIHKPINWDVNHASVQVMILLNDKMDLEAGGEKLSLSQGDCVILPAELGQVRVNPKGSSAQFVLAGAGGIPMIRVT